MSYQSKGLQYSLLIHAAIFSFITCTDISESRLNPPVVIDFSLIREAEEEKAEPPSEPEPPPQAEEAKIETPPPVQEIAPTPQTKAEPVQKKEKKLPVRAEKSKISKEKPKKIVRAERGGANNYSPLPPVRQIVRDQRVRANNYSPLPPVRQPVENTVSPQSATSAADAVPSPPSDTEKSLPAQSFPENSPVAAPAPGGSGNASSDSEGGSGSSSVVGYSKSGSGVSGSGSSGNSAFGSQGGPRYRHKEMPVYPALARRLGKEGKVLLRLTIDENGSLVNVEVIEDSGYGFADAAIAAVKKSAFIPPTLNGKPVRSRALLPVTFTLR
jgi:TonB family protein